MSNAAAYGVTANPPAPLAPRLAAFIDDALSAQTLGAVYAARSLTPPDVCEGGSAAALERLDAGNPPDVLLVDTGASSNPAEDIGVLRSLLPDEVRLVALGSRKAVGEYRNMMAAGVSEYLVKPVSREDLDDAIFGLEMQTSRSKIRAPAGGGATERHLVFVGARGGVGTTTVAVNTAWLMAQRSEQPSLLLDLDLRFGTTLLAFNLEPSNALVQMLQEPDRVDDVMVRQSSQDVAPHLCVLAAEEPIDVSTPVQPTAPLVLMRQARAIYHNVFIDMPADALHEMQPYVTDATDIVIVSDVSLAGVRDTIRLLSQFERDAPDAHCHIVIGGVSDPRKAPMGAGQFEESVGVKLAAAIPHDPVAFGESSSAGRPLVAFRKGTKAAKAYGEFVDRFLPPPRKSGWRFFGGRRKEAG